MKHLKEDKAVYEAIQKELNRQRNKLEMIASENIVSYAVMEAQGSVLTNKYAEGYPGKRYYGGCEYVDVVEQLAIDRAKELFGAEHVNVQPHSGSQANFAVYYGLLKPGDTMMGMNLTDGGHLSHGSPVNISGNYFNVVPYGVRKEDELLDYEAMEKTAKEVQPKLIIGGTSAYSASSTSNALQRSLMKSAHSSWSIWHTSPALSQAVNIRARCRGQIS